MGILRWLWAAVTAVRCRCLSPMRPMGRCEDGGEHLYCPTCDIHWSVGTSLDGWGNVWWKVDERGRMLNERD